MELITRNAGIKDVPEIHRITREAFIKYSRELGLPDKVSALKETPETIIRDLKNKHIIIAQLNDRIIGSVRYEIIDDSIVYISRFGVRTDIQNCGVGKALIKAVEDQISGLGIKTISLHTASKMTSLIRFYYGMGFYIHSTTTDRGYIRALLCKDMEPASQSQINVVNIK